MSNEHVHPLIQTILDAFEPPTQPPLPEVKPEYYEVLGTRYEHGQYRVHIRLEDGQTMWVNEEWLHG